MAFIRWYSKHQNLPLTLGRVNRRELTPQYRSPPEGSARESVRPPAWLLQAGSTIAPRGAEGNLAGLLAHLHPKTIPSWIWSASWSSVASQQAKGLLATCPLSISLQQKRLLSLSEELSTAGNCKHYTYSFLYLIIVFTVGLKIPASKVIFIPFSVFSLTVKNIFKIYLW